MAGQRPQKRLFTPEIKRYLKDWLVRRRENPYPNREEKKYLSRETGLTYVQVRDSSYNLTLTFCQAERYQVRAYHQPNWTVASYCYLYINRHYFCHRFLDYSVLFSSSAYRLTNHRRCFHTPCLHLFPSFNNYYLLKKYFQLVFSKSMNKIHCKLTDLQLVCQLAEKVEECKRRETTTDVGSPDTHVQRPRGRQRRTIQHMLRRQHLERARTEQLGAREHTDGRR